MFDEIKSTKVYEQVVEQIKTMVKAGVLKRGDKLPTERVMAEELGVSRTSVREALRALDVVGLIESRQGAGNYIKENFDSLLFEPLSIMFMLQESNLMEIYELREMLELETTLLAARKISNSQIEKIGQLVEDLKNSEDENISVKLDKELHYTIAEASGNKLIIDILEVLSQIMDRFIKDLRKDILADKENKEKLSNLHEKLYKALKVRNENEAYKVMKDHFNLIRRYIE
ncbi:FadR/GntR family transcriptional regulator [Clostridium carnis]